MGLNLSNDGYASMPTAIEHAMSDQLQVEYGKEYIHKTWGRVLFIAPHPCDGACLVIERQDTMDPDDDDRVLDTCERSDLSPAPDQGKWPYLGFTSHERSRERGRIWSAKHGFKETPEGSGRWFYLSGEPVPTSVWEAAWHLDYNAPMV